MQEYKTRDFFEMAAILHKAGKLPDDVEICEGMTKNGKQIGVAIYNDETQLPPRGEIVEYVQDFKMNYYRVKEIIMNKVKERKQNE